MTFILFVEGQTEEKVLAPFLKRWLDPRLDNPVGINTVRFEGWPELIEKAPAKARMHLCGPSKDDIIAIISLLDLYGPTIYPARLTESEKCYSWAKDYIEKKVDQTKFFQFFAVHELEAWLLSQPEIFPSEIRKAFPSKIQNPEKVNFDEPPAKMLNLLYNRQIKRSYKKIVNGVGLFKKLDPEIVYKNCPKFRELMDNMLDLAKKA